MTRKVSKLYVAYITFVISLYLYFQYNFSHDVYS